MNVAEIFKTPKTKQELCLIFNCDDRTLRSKISKMQKRYNIINLQDGKGYYIASDKDVEKYARQEMHRAIKIFNKARTMLKRVESKEEYKVPVQAHFRRITKKEINENQLTMF